MSHEGFRYPASLFVAVIVAICATIYFTQPDPAARIDMQCTGFAVTAEGEHFHFAINQRLGEEAEITILPEPNRGDL